MSFLEKWQIPARIVNADCTSSAGQACWETERCPLLFQARARSPASNPRVFLGSWEQPQDTGRVLYIYNKIFPLLQLVSISHYILSAHSKMSLEVHFNVLSALRAPAAVMYIIMLAGAAHGPGNC